MWFLYNCFRFASVSCVRYRKSFLSFSFVRVILQIPQLARLAQLVERKALNLVVVGSSPTVGDSVFANNERVIRRKKMRTNLTTQQMIKKKFFWLGDFQPWLWIIPVAAGLIFASTPNPCLPGFSFLGNGASLDIGLLQLF
ncbi:uncharacterized protein LOC141725155 isoform X3 [Apium graveolens]|uniref:uncharacterized protein LOC141725155 isoform X3 n=1 Tax=Apium graveolens TaxID=4045 RepID=UPI003D796CA3